MQIKVLYCRIVFIDAVVSAAVYFQIYAQKMDDGRGGSRENLKGWLSAEGSVQRCVVLIQSARNA